MAKYQLTSPEGRKFEVTAPDDASEEQVYQFFQQQTQPPQTREGQIDAEARKRQAGPGNVGTSDLAANSAGINVSPYIAGAGRGLTNYLTGKRLSGEAAGSLGDEYARERDIYKRQIDIAREEASGVEVPVLGKVPYAEIVGGFAMAPSGRAAAAVQGLPQAGGRVSNFLANTWDMAKAGAMWGAPAGFNENVGGTLGEKAETAAGGAIGGAILGPVLGHTIQGTASVVQAAKRPFDRMRADRAQHAANVQSDMTAAGITTDVPLTQAPGYQQDAGGLISSSYFGRPIRNQANRAMGELENNVRQQIDATGGNMERVDAGERIRQFARDQMLDPNRDMHYVRNMPEEQLRDITGFPAANPPMETDFPVRPNEVQRVTPDQYVQQAMDAVQPVPPRQVTDVNGRYQPATPDEVQLPPDTLKKVQKVQDEAIGLQHQKQALQQTIKENDDIIKARMPEFELVEMPRWMPGENKFSFPTKNGTYTTDYEGNLLWVPGRAPPPTPEFEDFARQSAIWLGHAGEYRQRLAQINHDIVRNKFDTRLANQEADLYRATEVQRLTEQRMNEARATAEAEAQSEAAIMTQRAREEARDRAMPDAVQQSEMRTRELAAREQARAEAEARQQHQQALAEHQARAEAPMELGGTQESMRTQLDAAYELVRRSTPQPYGITQGRANPLGRKGSDRNPAEGTPFVDTMQHIAAEARRRGRLEGWNGQLFDETGRLNTSVMDYVSANVPDNIAQRLRNLSERRGENKPGQHLEALRDFRSQLREAADDQWARRGAEAETRTYDTAMLQLMRDGIDQTIREVAGNLGPKGRAYIALLDKADAAYSQYMTDYRRRLRSVFDRDADAGRIFNIVREGTRNNATNFQTLERLYDLAGSQGNATLNQTSLTGMLLSDMARGGPREFLQAFRELSPEARRVMFAGPNEQLGRTLEAMSRAGGHLERWTEVPTGRADGIPAWVLPVARELTRSGNLATGLLGFFNMPAAVTAAVGNNMAARFLTSRAYGRWLRSEEWTQALRYGPASPEWKQALGALGSKFTAGMPPEAGKKAMEVWNEAMGIKPAHGLFAGEASQTKDWIALKIAQAMTDKKEDPKKIYAETGWFMGKDGKWRYEMDDTGSDVSKAGLDAFKKTRFTAKNITTNLGSIFKHSALFEAFPQLKDVKVKFTNARDAAEEMGDATNDWGAAWISESRTMLVNSTGIEHPQQLRVFLLHEIQHVLQDENNFDYGPMRNDNYDKRYGEVEAYNVMRRAHLTPEQRRGSYPPNTQNVPFGQIQLSKPPATAQKGN